MAKSKRELKPKSAGKNPQAKKKKKHTKQVIITEKMTMKKVTVMMVVKR